LGIVVDPELVLRKSEGSIRKAKLPPPHPKQIENRK